MRRHIVQHPNSLSRACPPCSFAPLARRLGHDEARAKNPRYASSPPASAPRKPLARQGDRLEGSSRSPPPRPYYERQGGPSRSFDRSDREVSPLPSSRSQWTADHYRQHFIELRSRGGKKGPDGRRHLDTFAEFHQRHFTDPDAIIAAVRAAPFVLPPLEGPPLVRRILLDARWTPANWPAEHIDALLAYATMTKQYGDLQITAADRMTFNEARILVVRRVQCFINNEDEVRPQDRERREYLLRSHLTEAHSAFKVAQGIFVYLLEAHPDLLASPSHSFATRQLAHNAGRNVGDLEALDRYRQLVAETPGAMLSDGYFYGAAYAYSAKAMAGEARVLLDEMRGEAERRQWFASAPQHPEPRGASAVPVPTKQSRGQTAATAYLNKSRSYRWPSHVERAGETWGRIVMAHLAAGEDAKARELLALAESELPADLYWDALLTYAVEVSKLVRPLSDGTDLVNFLSQQMRAHSEQPADTIYCAIIPWIAKRHDKAATELLVRLYRSYLDALSTSAIQLRVSDFIVVADHILLAVFDPTTPLASSLRLMADLLEFYDAFQRASEAGLVPGTDPVCFLPHGSLVRIVDGFTRIGRPSVALRLVATWNDARVDLADLAASPYIASLPSFRIVDPHAIAPLSRGIEGHRDARRLVNWTKETIRLALGGYTLASGTHQPPPRHLAIAASYLLWSGHGPDGWLRDRARAADTSRLTSDERTAIRALAATDVVEVDGRRTVKPEARVLAPPVLEADQEAKLALKAGWRRPTAAALQARERNLGL